jgi:predicted nucleic acid-binding protein
VKILLDINIWIDIAARKNSFPDSRALIKSLHNRRHEVCFPLSGYTTFYYLLKQLLGEHPARAFCKLLEHKRISLLSFSTNEIEIAHSLNFTDHEDACIAATALRNKCNFIATRDLKGFKNSPIAASSPSELLKVL